MKKQIKNMRSLKLALEIENAGGAVAASAWVSGSGRYARRRPVPVFCAEIDLAGRPGDNARRTKTESALRSLLRRRPKLRKAIAITDWRGFNRAKKAVAERKPSEPPVEISGDLVNDPALADILAGPNA